MFCDHITGQVSLWGSAGVTEELTFAKDSPGPKYIVLSSLLGWSWHHLELNQLTWALTIATLLY